MEATASTRNTHVCTEHCFFDVRDIKKATRDIVDGECRVNLYHRDGGCTEFLYGNDAERAWEALRLHADTGYHVPGTSPFTGIDRRVQEWAQEVESDSQAAAEKGGDGTDAAPAAARVNRYVSNTDDKGVLAFNFKFNSLTTAKHHPEFADMLNAYVARFIAEACAAQEAHWRGELQGVLTGLGINAPQEAFCNMPDSISQIREAIRRAREEAADVREHTRSTLAQGDNLIAQAVEKALAEERVATATHPYTIHLDAEQLALLWDGADAISTFRKMLPDKRPTPAPNNPVT